MYSNDEIKKKFALLPKDIQTTLSSIEVDKKIQNIGKKYDLHIDQIGLLGEIVGFVLLGFTPRKNLIAEVKKELEINSTQASLIVSSVDNEIFKPVRESMEKIESPENTKGEDVAPTQKPSAMQDDYREDVPIKKSPLLVSPVPSSSQEISGGEPTVVTQEDKKEMGQQETPTQPSTEEAPSPVIKSGAFVVRDLLHEKSPEEREGVIRKKLQEDFKVGAEKTEVENTPDQGEEKKVDTSIAPKSSHDPYRELPN